MSFVPVLLALACSTIGQGPAADPRPLRALLVCGGCCHDYQRQKDIIAKGLAERAFIEVTIAHQGGSSTASKIPLYEKADWAKGFDIVIHDECFADAKDQEWTRRVLAPHREGLPGVVLHCAMHSYRDGSNQWFDFCGVTSRRHGKGYPHEVTNVDTKHAIMKEFGPSWANPAGELYWIEKVHPTAHVLGSSKNQENGRDEACVWTNEYEKKARVFGTTLGHHNETVSSDAYLDLLTRGVLWACDKLEPRYLKPEKSKLNRVNQAARKTAKASSEELGKGNLAANAVDGDLSTRWCAADSGSGQWLQVDLGQVEPVTGVIIDWESTETAYKHRVEGSNDGKGWTLLADASVEAQPGESSHEFAGKSARFIRVTYLGSDRGGWGSIRELEVYGDKLAPADAVKKASATDASLLREIKAPEGYEATIFAKPPSVVYPVFVSASPEGDVYVSVDRNGSLDRAAHRGSILRLRDVDGDGRADEVKTLVTDVDSPRGLVWDHDRLYLMHPPHLSVYIDKNHDGKADEARVLVKNIAFGFKDRPADHTSNGVTLGIDGWLYLAIGDFGFLQAEGTDGRKLQMRGGGVVRVRPDGTGLELFAKGTRNILEVSIDPLLNTFARDNTNDGGGWDIRLHHFSGLENHGYPSLFRNFSDEAITPLADYGGGSGCGGLFLSEPGFPERDNNALYTVDWGRERIFRHKMTPKGATFTADQEDFLALPRATDLDVDANSRIYAASWKGASFTYVGENVGFLVRLTPKGYKPDPLPNFDRLDPADLVALLESPSSRRRMEAQRALIRRGIDRNTAEALEKLTADRAKPLPFRVAALFALKQGLQAGSTPILVRLAQDPSLREHAIRALTDRLEENADVPEAPIVSALADANPRIRRQAAVSLARLGRPNLASRLAPLLADSDPVVAHTAIAALVELKGRDAALAVLDAATSTPAARVNALHALKRLHDSSTVTALAARLQGESDPSRRAGLFAALCRLHDVEGKWKGESWGTRPDTSGPYYQSDRWEESDNIDKLLRMALQRATDDELAADLRQLSLHKIRLVDGVFLFHDKDGLAHLIARAKRNSRLAPGLLTQIALLKSLPQTAEPYLVEVATGAGSPDELRSKAIVALSRGETESGLFAQLEGLSKISTGESSRQLLTQAGQAFLKSNGLTFNQNMLIREAERKAGDRSAWADAALLTLSNDKGGLAAKALDRAWKDPARVAQVLRAVALAEHKGSADRVLSALNDPNPAVAEAAKGAATVLRLDRPGNSARPSGPLVKVLGIDRALDQIVATKGDRAAGERIFNRLNCLNCHTVKPTDPPKGPYLGNIAATYKRRDLAESILRPSKTLAQGFTTTVLALDDGTTVTGFIVKEAADAITLRTAEAKELVIPVARIEERAKRDVSVMPEGLVNEIGMRDFASLLDYLESLNTK